MRGTRKRCVNKWRRGEREKRKGNFSPQSLIIKLTKSSKITKKEKGIYLLKVETWDGQKPGKKKKERKTILKKKKRREKERKKEKRNCLPLWWKLGRTKKRKRKGIRQSVKKKGDKRKSKVKKKKKKEKEREQWNDLFFFFMLFLLSLPSLKWGDVTRYPTGRREIKLLLLVFELTVSSRQKKWPLRKNVGHTGETRCWYLVTSGRRTPEGEEDRSQMIG